MVIVFSRGFRQYSTTDVHRLYRYMTEDLMSGTEHRFRTIVMDHLGVEEEEITPQANFKDDLGADSLDVIEMVMACEDEFKLDIPDEDAEKMTTFSSALEYLHGRLAAKEIKA